MSDRDVKFVEVVKSPIGGGSRDFTDQLTQGNSFADVFAAVRRDWYADDPDLLGDADFLEQDISDTLDILKAEFSKIDPLWGVKPLFNDIDFEAVAFELSMGLAPVEHRWDLSRVKDSHGNFELSPILLSLTEVLRHLETANKIGYCASIFRDQLLIAKDALEVEHLRLSKGETGFEAYRPPSLFILSGAEINLSCANDRKAKGSEAHLLNVLFLKEKEPAIYKRISALKAQALG